MDCMELASHFFDKPIFKASTNFSENIFEMLEYLIAFEKSLNPTYSLLKFIKALILTVSSKLALEGWEFKVLTSWSKESIRLSWALNLLLHKRKKKKEKR